MLRSTYWILAVFLLLGVSSGFTGSAHHAPAWNVPQVADGGDPIPPPFPLGPQVVDGGDPIPPPFPLGPQVADGGDPIPPPFPLAA